MANWIVTEIELTGDRLFLERLEKIINDCNDGPIDDGSNWVGHIFGALGINVKKCGERAFWSYAHFNKYGHLVFRESSAWNRSNCAKVLKQHFSQEISGVNYKYIGWY